MNSPWALPRRTPPTTRLTTPGTLTAFPVVPVAAQPLPSPPAKYLPPSARIRAARFGSQPRSAAASVLSPATAASRASASSPSPRRSTRSDLSPAPRAIALSCSTPSPAATRTTRPRSTCPRRILPRSLARISRARNSASRKNTSSTAWTHASAPAWKPLSRNAPKLVPSW